ncbi:MAG: CBS domain-containing protein [Bacteriovoracales bacterium]
MNKIDKNLDFYNFIKYGITSDVPAETHEELKVSDIMSENPFCLNEHDEISLLDEVMELEKVHHVPIINNENEVVGILTHRDFLSLLISAKKENLKKKVKVSEVMKKDIQTIENSDSLILAAERFYKNRTGSLLVVKKKKLVGIITPFDLLKLLDKKHLVTKKD